MTWIVPAAVLLDLLFGDPRVRWHPVRLVGLCVGKAEFILRKSGLDGRFGGGILLVTVMLLSVLPVAGLIYGIDSAFGQFLAGTITVYFSIALKSLLSIARRIRKSVERGQLEEARKTVSEICGRDTARLDATQITKATVESVAENTVDGFTAPIFYAALFGPLGAWAYRVANTLDSMVGYKSDKYIHFGWASARFDDILNFIPSRLTAWILSLWAPIVGGKVGESISCVSRFSRLHPSPNAGWPESAAAGALGIRLGGPAMYDGEEVEKPYFGWETREPVPRDILRASRLSFFSSMTFALLLCLAARVMPS